MKEKISVKSFVEEFVNNKVKNTPAKPNAVDDFIRDKLEIIEYVPFNTKREVVEMVVANSVSEESGVKRVDSVAQFLSFITSMIMTHTNLTFGKTPAEDYDALNQTGLLELIVEMFQKDYSECEALMKMIVADELVDNNLNVIVGKFLNGILDKLDGVIDIVKDFTESADLSKLLGTNINEEEMAKILGLIDKLNK